MVLCDGIISDGGLMDKIELSTPELSSKQHFGLHKMIVGCSGSQS